MLFTFLEGYNYIFAEIHGTSEGVTGLCFLGIIIGLFTSLALVPLIYSWAKKEMVKAEEQGHSKIAPEFRLWYSMLGGSFAIPISLFWMAWTSRPDISIWSPLGASVLFGYGILCIFITRYVASRPIFVRPTLTKHNSQLPIHYRLVRNLCCQRTCIGHDDPLRCFRWHGHCCDTILQEHGRTVYSDDNGLLECFDDTFAICVLQVRTLDQEQVETCDQTMRSHSDGKFESYL